MQARKKRWGSAVRRSTVRVGKRRSARVTRRIVVLWRFSEQERQRIRDMVHSAQFEDRPPGEVYASLLDRGPSVWRAPDFVDTPGMRLNARGVIHGTTKATTVHG